MEEKEIPLVRMWVSGEINKSRIAASITAFCCLFVFFFVFFKEVRMSFINKSILN